MSTVRRFNQEYHEEWLIRHLNTQLNRATSLKRRTRLGERLRKAEARLLAHRLANS